MSFSVSRIFTSCLATLMGLGMNTVNSSAYGHIYWEKMLTSSLGYTVEFSVEVGFPSDSYYGGNYFNFGDGYSIYLEQTECGDSPGVVPCSTDTVNNARYEVLFEETDVNNTQTYIIGQWIFNHTYSNSGPYDFNYTRYCRYVIESVQNLQSSDAQVILSGRVNGLDSTLHNNKYSIESSLPSILQRFVPGGQSTIDLDPIDLDSDNRYTIVCNKANFNESGLTDQSFYSLDGSSNCIIYINGLNGNHGDKWHIQISMETYYNGQLFDRVPLEFLLEAYNECNNVNNAQCTSQNCGSEIGGNPYCTSQNSWGCSSCQNGYFMKNHQYLCIPCQDIGCSSCGDWTGCAQNSCINNLTYHSNGPCGIAQCLDI